MLMVQCFLWVCSWGDICNICSVCPETRVSVDLLRERVAIPFPYTDPADIFEAPVMIPVTSKPFRLLSFQGRIHVCSGSFKPR